MKLEKITRYRKGWAYEEQRKLFELYQSGAELKQILDAFKYRTRTGVIGKMNKLGMTTTKGTK